MKRLNLFVKGNVDVHDSLHMCRIGGVVHWNGINDVLRAQHPGVLARVRYETYSRSDALAITTGEIPDILTARSLNLGSYPLTSQFSDSIFRTQADAYILSIQPDVTASLIRHNQTGTLLYPSEIETWSKDDRTWARSDFTSLGFLTPDQSMANLEAIVAKLAAANSAAPVLVFNLSPIMPGDTTHCYMGLDETYATRIKRFNLALVELSQSTGISIVDVDTLVARQGASALKLDMVHLTPTAYSMVAEEVVRILEDLGVLDIATETVRNAS